MTAPFSEFLFLFSTVGSSGLTRCRIDNYCDQQHCARNHKAVRRFQIKQDQAVIDGLNNQNAKQRGESSTAPTKEAGSADYGGGNGAKFEVVSGALRSEERRVGKA